jgi:hypothetical protein
VSSLHLIIPTHLAVKIIIKCPPYSITKFFLTPTTVRRDGMGLSPGQVLGFSEAKIRIKVLRSAVTSRCILQSARAYVPSVLHIFYPSTTVEGSTVVVHIVLFCTKLIAAPRFLVWRLLLYFTGGLSLRTSVCHRHCVITAVAVDLASTVFGFHL